MNNKPNYDALSLAVAAKDAASRAAQYQLSVALDSWARGVIVECSKDETPNVTILTWDLNTFLTAMAGAQTIERLVEMIESILIRIWQEQHKCYSQIPPWHIEAHLINANEQQQIIRFARARAHLV